MGEIVKVSVGKRWLVVGWGGAGGQACLWFARSRETTRWSDARDEKLPPSLIDNEDDRTGRWRLETFSALPPCPFVFSCVLFFFAHWHASVIAAAAACPCSSPKLSPCECVLVGVCAAAEEVVLRPWCAALSFRVRSHRQPPQEALAPPPWNDAPSLPPPLLLLPPPFLFSDLTQQAKDTELSER